MREDRYGRPVKRRATATTPEARENQLMALAYDVAEEQLRNKTASSQVITHFLKLATAREKLEQERLKKENQLLEAKTKAIESGEHMEELYSNAIQAFKGYEWDY